MKRLSLFLLLIAAACASGPDQPIGPPAMKVAGYTAATGPTPVGVIPSATLHDAQRNRDVEVSVDYPTRGGPFPVIVFSHAYGLSNRDYEPLIAYWTSNGYLCIRAKHADAGVLRERMREMMPQQSPRQMGERRRGARETAPQPAPQAQRTQRPNPMQEYLEKETPEQRRERVADVRFVIDSLGELEQQFPELRGKIDAANIGVAGHSYGALTVLDLNDPRVKAVLAMDPPALSESHGITAQPFADLRSPVLIMASEGEPASVFQALPAGNKYRVEISGVTPMTYTGMMGFRGGFDRERPVVTSTSTYQSQRQPVRGPAVMPGRRGFEIVEIASLAFWDAYLGHQTAARELLQPEKFDASFSGATITAK